MTEEENLTFRLYGRSPYTITVIHGGPGAAGEMAPVAKKLSQNRGVIEPIQTATSIAGQIRELKLTLEQHASLPATLIGYSWGAWLSCLLAAYHRNLVKKLILVSSGPFEAKDAHSTAATRLSRFTHQQRKDFDTLIKELQNPTHQDQSQILSRLGAICSKADTFRPIEEDLDESPSLAIDTSIYQKIWSEAENLRKTGALLNQLKKITCPITAIHGDYDPHPASGVKNPLSKILPQFHFILLPNCGHKPWIEQHAQETFYQILERELELQSR